MSRIVAKSGIDSGKVNRLLLCLLMLFVFSFPEPGERERESVEATTAKFGLEGDEREGRVKGGERERERRIRQLRNPDSVLPDY